MKSDIRVCFVGDSFTQGTGDETSLGWVGSVCSHARQEGYDVTGYNLGIRRETSLDILHRWNAECDRRFPSGCDARIVFSFGANDTSIENGQQRVSISESIENATSILTDATTRYPVLFVSSPPVEDPEQNYRILELSDRISSVCSTLNVPFIDLYNPLVLDRDYYREVAENDGSHPRQKGYRKIARIILSSPNWWFNPLSFNPLQI
ncbi:MAG: lipase [Cyanobacteria bacterium SID2]|nr:lipase [Cyanobacteria bacterium SID2]MBP0006714.1 lipase [Cyanobacteria bacterium SBC]